jgi:hypothetical protein
MILAEGIPTPSLYYDEYLYIKMARSLVQLNFTRVFSEPGLIHTYPPLYPVLLVPALLLDGMRSSYVAMKFTNALVLSTLVAPVWVLSREFLDEKESAIFTLVSVLTPWSLVYPSYILSENLFIPLFLVSIILEVSVVLCPTLRNQIALGIVMGLSYLTRYAGIVLFAPLIMLFALEAIRFVIKEQKAARLHTLLAFAIPQFFRTLRRRWVVFGAFLIPVLPFFFAQGIANPQPIGEAIGLTTGMATLASHPSSGDVAALAQWIIMHLNYGAVAVGIVLFSTSLVPIFGYRAFIRGDRGWKLLLFTVAILTSFFFFVLMASLESLGFFSSPPLAGLTYLGGRYLDPVLPALFVVGVVSLRETKAVPDRYFPIALFVFSVTAISVLSVPYMWQLLTPSFSISANYVEAGQYHLYRGVVNWGFGGSFVPIFVFILCLAMTAFIRIRRLTWARMVPLIGICLLVFFLWSSHAAYGLTYWEANSSHHELQLSAWMTDNHVTNVTLLVDDRLPDSTTRRIYWGMRFWELLAPGGGDIRVVIGNVANSCAADYLLSAAHLNLPDVMSYVDNGTTYYLYRVPHDRLGTQCYKQANSNSIWYD